MPLQAHFTSQNDLTPTEFEISGRNARTASIDEGVEAGTEKIRVREDKAWREETRPEKFFTIAGYAPATMQMLLVQYWKAHGSPAKLRTIPNRRSEDRGARKR